MTTGESNVFEVPPAAGRLWVSLLEGLIESGPAPCEFYPEAWFASHWREVQIAKRACAECPVREVCLAYAVTAGERHGVWGGRFFGGRRSKAAS